MTNDFYKNIHPMVEFSNFTTDRYFHKVPDDWLIILSDIKGSTKAVAEGRFKDVNMLGASTIMAIMNELNEYEIPFVFGGDGSTILIPSMLQHKIEPLLIGLKHLAKSQFALELRIGIVPIQKIHQFGGSVEVAKYSLVAGNPIALFRGGGLSLAEKWCKTSGPNGENYLIEKSADQPVKLAGLSCRWQPLKNKNGVIFTFMVQIQKSFLKQEKEILEQLNRDLENILGKKLTDLSPVRYENLKENPLHAGFLRELKFRLQNRKNPLFETLKYLFVFVFSQTMIQFRIKLPFWDAGAYRKSTPQHSDYKKFDDTLRMVLDITLEQAEKLESHFTQLEQKGQIHFGVAKSTDALMTCMVFSAPQNQHIHFIDGGSGGYTLAAKEMKAKI